MTTFLRSGRSIDIEKCKGKGNGTDKLTILSFIHSWLMKSSGPGIRGHILTKLHDPILLWQFNSLSQSDIRWWDEDYVWDICEPISYSTSWKKAFQRRRALKIEGEWKKHILGQIRYLGYVQLQGLPIFLLSFVFFLNRCVIPAHSCPYIPHHRRDFGLLYGFGANPWACNSAIHWGWKSFYPLINNQLFIGYLPCS